ncbi:histidine kinase [Pleurocapsa sp. FMAR1]|uniref:histidine kinase n=1 Tax=Pleurocapsa sp. FMAR1 TaxID=3040204 RepID=UPI0029C6F40F|nr:histidine kinase [Pleurocapsa sp. FMAR1]
MSESNESKKERIIADLQQAKQTGELKTDKIREIVKNAIAQTIAEYKEGKSEVANLVEDAIAAVTETFKEKSGEIKEEVTASIQGAIDGISEARKQKITQTQSEITTLEAKVVADEQELQDDIDKALAKVKSKSETEPDKIKVAVSEAITGISNSEEFALLQKHYARLKAQTSVLQANLANRYGEQYEEVNKHLEEAKTWYEKAKEDPEVFTEPAKRKRAEFEQKLGATGGAVARKEKEVKGLLKELWKEVREIFQEKTAK